MFDDPNSNISGWSQSKLAKFIEQAVLLNPPPSTGGGTEGSLVTPAGSIILFAGSTVLPPYLLCDGASYLRTTYPSLFSTIGTTYGAADGTHFNVPNLKGRIVVGQDSSQAEFDVLGEVGGSKTHTLVNSEIPTVVGTLPHGTLPNTEAVTGTNTTMTTGSSTTRDVNNAGGGQAHNNLQPYIVLSYIIRT